MADFDLKITKMVEITKFRLVPGWCHGGTLGYSCEQTHSESVLV